jgi:manganese transport protein
VRRSARRRPRPRSARRSRLAAPGRHALLAKRSLIRTRPTGPLWRKLLTFLGPGYLVAVGHMDPGNWATSLAGGSKFGYALLTIALLST